jgi:hypothetical protein
MDIIKYAMEEIKNPKVVKKTVSIINKSISAELRFPCRAKAFVVNRREHSVGEITEGEIFGIPMMENNDANIANFIAKITDVLQTTNTLFELVVFIDEKREKLGVALVEYFDPANW